MLCRQEPLRQALEEPKIQVANPTELLRSRSLHAAFRALHAFRREQGHLPRPRAPVGPHPALRGPSSPLPPFPWLASHLCPQADAERVLELAQSLGAQQGPLDDDIVRAFASVSAGDLCPVAAVVGAMAAQEVLKVSGMGVPGSEVPLVTLCSAVQWRLVTTRGHLLPAWGRRAGQQRWAGEHGDPAGLSRQIPFAPGHHRQVPAPGPVVVLRRPGVPGAGGDCAGDGGGLRPGESTGRAPPGCQGCCRHPQLCGSSVLAEGLSL